MTHADLVEATGFKRPSDQLAALKGIGMRPLIGPGGVPRVTWEAYNAALAGFTSADVAAAAVAGGLNWNAVGGAR